MIGPGTSPPRHRVVAVIVPGDGPHLVALPADVSTPAARWRRPRLAPVDKGVTSLPMSEQELHRFDTAPARDL